MFQPYGNPTHSPVKAQHDSVNCISQSGNLYSTCKKMEIVRASLFFTRPKNQEPPVSKHIPP
ncbi:unnamed protein product [Chondrus crispus]|uniref:Uncharacterized protein n=1 Tax=Chondrus crispus TaxID=2769 RepID=R7Q5B3_CHOCR|nr:unnamed protein product [Chondrus crispus]CDF32650.1 unnamed protein product [Chondrus crispus]|eukprot:XP_005712421.1 unnamed protein product [Chondrus crispus]